MVDRFLMMIRSALFGASENLEKGHQHALLARQVREAGQVVQAARNAVALTLAEQARETGRLERIGATLADLETRAVKAIQAGRDDLARDAAEAIAALEDDRDATRQARKGLETELASLKERVRDAEARLRDLQRGRSVTAARERIMQAGGIAASTERSSLGDAEATLDRIRARQDQERLTEDALLALSSDQAPDRIIDRLAAAGCGAPLQTSTDSVLDRLRLKADGQHQPLLISPS